MKVSSVSEMRALDRTAIAKFGIVALLVALLSYGVSRYVLRPHPRLVVIGLLALSVLLAVLT